MLKEEVLNIAKQVSAKLNDRGVSTKPPRASRPRKNLEKEWWVDFGKEGVFDFVLTQDDKTDGLPAKIWVGLVAAETTPINLLLRNFSDIARVQKYTSRAISDAKMMSNLTKGSFEVPVLEHDDEGKKNYFGVYSNLSMYDLDRASDFLLRSLGQKKLDAKGEPITTYRQVIEARRGQNRFRADLRKVWGNACAVTGCKVSEALRASHIRAWNDEATSPTQRIDQNNGLLLIASLDALFDKHLISFHDREMVVAGSLSKRERAILGIPKALCKDLNEEQAGYMKYHLALHKAKYGDQ